MKIDLHCHSKYSKRATVWLMQKIGCPESFTEPKELYRIQRSKGMDGVTITDHNAIDGALEIADLPGAFVSDEATVYFPEDGCKIHVLVYGITEAQFRVIQEVRKNVYEFTDYVRRENIPTVLAHPLYAVSDRLSVEHVEKCVLLFKNWEINGDQCPTANTYIPIICSSLTPAVIERLANKHGIEPAFPEPWIKNLTAGSDDHGSLHLARAFTEVEGATNMAEFFAGIERGETKLHHRPATPQMLAHNYYGIAYQYYNSKFGIERHAAKDPFLGFMDRILTPRPEGGRTLRTRMESFVFGGLRAAARHKPPEDSTMIGLLRAEASGLIREDARFTAAAKGEAPGPEGKEGLLWDFAVKVSNKMIRHMGGHLLRHATKANVFDVFHTLGSSSSLYAVLAPYFAAYALHAKEKRFSRKALRSFLDGRARRAEFEDPVSVVKFTDTLKDGNGVAITLRRQVRAAAAAGRPYTLISCEPGGPSRERGIVNFDPIGTFSLPEYPQQAVNLPPFMEMLDYCHRENHSLVHTATPGPAGLAALAIARILRLPIVSTYHTAFPQYAMRLTGSDFITGMTWRFMLWYYGQMDAVYAPSRATADELIEHGLPASKVKLYPRGVDVERFNPARRDERLLGDRYVAGEGIRILYAGRLSKEKSLDVLAAAFRQLCRRHPGATLVLAGEGPFEAELKTSLAGLPAVFTGWLETEEMANVFASADLFVFPSATDTFGNVVLEAQASGLPVIVTTEGGPAENLIPGETGLLVPPGDAEALASAMETMIHDRERLARMGTAARRYAEGRSFAKAFDSMWDLYREAAEPGGPAKPSAAAKTQGLFAGALSALAD